jgi:hypothetical protein
MTAVKYRLRFAARQATDAPSLASATIISLPMKNYENDARGRQKSKDDAAKGAIADVVIDAVSDP